MAKYKSTRWVVPNKIMRSSRPGYPNARVGIETTNQWLMDIFEEYGFIPKSILVFLSDRELGRFYNFDLLEHYSTMGIDVYHMPTSDPYRPKKTGNVTNWQTMAPAFTFEDLNDIKKIIQKAKKPILIHCSAGVDRTGQVAKYLEFIYTGKVSR